MHNSATTFIVFIFIFMCPTWPRP